MAPSGLPNDSLRPKSLLVILLLALVLLTLAACARISNPRGWSSGTVAGDALYIGTPQGELRALYIGMAQGEELVVDPDRELGETLWRFELRGEESERAIYGTPALDADTDTLYIGGYDSILYALSTDGVLKGRETLGDSIVGSPVLVDGLVLVGSSDGNMYAFEAVIDDDRVTFDRKWRFPTGDKVWSTAAVADGVAYFGSMDKYVYAVNLEDGTEKWRFKTKGAVAASPLVARELVYVGSFDSVFYAIDAETGEMAWRFDGADNWYWGGAIADEDTIYAPSLDGSLYALDMDTGSVRWTLETEKAIVGSPAIVLDMIAVASSDGRVRLVRRSDGTDLDGCNIGEKIRTSLAERVVGRNGFIYFAARDKSIRSLRIKPSGNPDEEWVHFTNEDDPLPRGLAPAC